MSSYDFGYYKHRMTKCRERGHDEYHWVRNGYCYGIAEVDLFESNYYDSKINNNKYRVELLKPRKFLETVRKIANKVWTHLKKGHRSSKCKKCEKIIICLDLLRILPEDQNRKGKDIYSLRKKVGNKSFLNRYFLCSSGPHDIYLNPKTIPELFKFYKRKQKIVESTIFW